jgi:hypothetical protein
MLWREEITRFFVQFHRPGMYCVQADKRDLVTLEWARPLQKDAIFVFILTQVNIGSQYIYSYGSRNESCKHLKIGIDSEFKEIH